MGYNMESVTPPPHFCGAAATNVLLLIATFLLTSLYAPPTDQIKNVSCSFIGIITVDTSPTYFLFKIAD
jgi:hypothetical protein